MQQLTEPIDLALVPITEKEQQPPPRSNLRRAEFERAVERAALVERRESAARVAGAQVVLLGGEPALFVERGGRSLVPLREPEDGWLREALSAFVEHVRMTGVKRLAVERFDGEPVGESEVMPLLLEAGFVAGPRRAVLRP